MPMHSYATKDGRVVEVFHHPGDPVPERIRIGHDWAHRSWKHEIPTSMGGASEHWRRGLVSTACGVHPNQVVSEKARLEKAVGHPVHFNSDGDIVFHSRKERREILKACGMKDNDGGYGDGA